MTSFLARIEGILYACWRWLGVGANAALLVIMFGVSADAILRYALNRPVAGTLEGVELLLVFSVFLSLAGTQAARGHVTVDIVLGMLGGRPRAALQAFTAALGLVLFAIVTWATGDMAIRSWQMGEYSAGLIAFPIYPSRILVAFGSLLLSVQLLLEFARAVVSMCREPTEDGADAPAPAEPVQ